MRRRLALVALLLAAFATTACGSGGGAATSTAAASASASATATATPTPTPTPTPTTTPTTSTTPYALVVSVSAVTLVDTEGTPMTSASFGDGAAVLALLTSSTGTTPAGSTNAQYGNTVYDWGGLILNVSAGNTAAVNISATAVGALQVRADGGLAVGSPSMAAQAQGATADPAGLAQLRYEITEVPGTNSLQTPGATGVQFVLFILDGDAISRIISPADDYSDL